MDDTDADLERVATVEAVRAGPAVVSAGGRSIALFHHEGEVYAVDNRCPHMGFPLSKGTVEDGLLTCHWHHARFELACGDTFDVWADDVQTFPTAVRDGEVYVDPDPEPDVPPATRWRDRLGDGMAENLPLVIAKAVINLDDLGEGFATPLETAVEFGTAYRADGWGRGLTTLAAMANLYPLLDQSQRRRAMYAGVTAVADNCDGEPPRFDQYALDNESLSKARLKSWFRDTCEVRDTDGAERCLRAAAAALPPDEVVEILLAAGSDHLYMNSSHTLDFLTKAIETLDHVGWGHAEDVLAATVDQVAEGSRAEETSAWRRPVDVAALCFEAREDLPALAAAGDGTGWTRPEGFVETLLGDDPGAIVETLREAIRAGAGSEQVAHAVAVAALRRVVQFATANEFRDWNTVHHTLSYANAVENLARRTDAAVAYRPVFDAAMAVYLDRFLNQPAAPVPDPGKGTDEDPAALRERLLATFDEHGRVDEAGRLVSEHFDAGGDPGRLKRTLAEGLLREDADFHTRQHLEVGVRQFDLAESEHERRLALMAPARYMAAHFPTRREGEQTFAIAERLHRGERLHDDEG